MKKPLRFAVIGAGRGRTFIDSAAIREGRLPMIDVYDAVSWSSITPLSEQSIAQGNIPLAVPNFKGPRP